MGSDALLKAVSTEDLAAELISRRKGSLLEGAGSPRYPADAQDWELPPEVTHHFARLDTDGKAALAACDWWQQLKNDPSNWEPDPDYDHRQANKMHFVQGLMSPYYIEAMQEVVPEGEKKTRAASRKVWAVWFGPYTSNGGQKVGVAQVKSSRGRPLPYMCSLPGPSDPPSPRPAAAAATSI